MSFYLRASGRLAANAPALREPLRCTRHTHTPTLPFPLSDGQHAAVSVSPSGTLRLAISALFFLALPSDFKVYLEMAEREVLSCVKGISGMNKWAGVTGRSRHSPSCDLPLTHMTPSPTGPLG